MLESRINDSRAAHENARFTHIVVFLLMQNVKCAGTGQQMKGK